MSDDLDALKASIAKQASLVRQLKADRATQPEIEAAVSTLQELRKKEASLLANSEDVNKLKVDKEGLDNLLTRRMFVVPSFEIHGGVSGLYDYGPPGCSVKENVLNIWRQHFVLEDNMLQIECTTLTPHVVLKTSGHVDKFEDLMVKDVKTGECFRADKLLEDVIENKMRTDTSLTASQRDELRRIAAQADSFSPAELEGHFKALNINSPTTGNPLSSPFPFNLMFATQIGPTGQLSGFLRPETAQGMFVNFRRLYDYNNGRMPMAVAQIGSAYRNEIAPRGGLLRVREFTMAEIEHFVHPQRKNHPKFASVAHLRLNLFPSESQVGDGKLITPTLGEAVAQKIVDNETIAYFMARTYLFLLRVGVRPEALRFRQHLPTEMAHYAQACWDAEILMSSGWVECVGHADRSAYDLAVHSQASKTELVARDLLPEPVEEPVAVAKVNKGLLGKSFKLDNVAVVNALDDLAANLDDALKFEEILAANGSADLEILDKSGEKKTVQISRDMVSFSKGVKKVTERKYIPNVVEPSFGIGRILTGIFEHSFYVRENDAQRTVLRFKPSVAPVKAVVLPLDARLRGAAVEGLCQNLVRAGLAASVDDSGVSVGKRYARSDEIGIPFAVTYDHESPKDNQVTLRERDSCAQVRLPLDDLVPVIRDLVNDNLTWENVVAKYGLLATTSEE